MGQFVDFAVQVGKDGVHHVNLCRKLLRVVEKEQPSQRRFALWLQQNQIYDRTLLQFLLKLCDIKVAQKTMLGEVGQELAAEAAKSPVESAGAPDPGGDFDEGAEPGARKPGPSPAPGKKPTAPKVAAPPPEPPKDPFCEALFQRFVELNGYLARFVFCEIQDGFLAFKEVSIRIGSSAYHGERPTGNQLNAWVKWMEFLRYMKPVGFRHKLSAVGMDAWKYLKEIPEESLIERGALGVLDGIAEPSAAPADTRKFLTAEELGAGHNAPPAGPLPEAKPPGKRAEPRNGNDEALPGDDEEADFGPAGAPPETRDATPDEDEDDDPAQAWKKGDAKTAANDEEEELSPDDEDAIRELFGEVHAPPPKPKKPPKSPEPKKGEAAPAPVAPTPAHAPAPPAAAQAPAPAAPAPATSDPAALIEKAAAAEARNERAAREAGERRAASPPPREPIAPVPLHPEPPGRALPALPPSAPASLRDEQVELLAAQWEAAPGRRTLTAREAGIAGDFSDGRRAFALFCLATAATVLEADAPFPAKIAALRELERARTLENFFELDWTLEKALDALGLVDPGREIGAVEERLLHLPRLKRALGRKGALESLDAARGERADLLRRMTGHALGGGAYWVEREMKRLGLW